MAKLGTSSRSRIASSLVSIPSTAPSRPSSGSSSGFLAPLPRTTLTADISRTLVSHLMRGQWQEGEKIPPERDLCLKLGVGRASLREALKGLEIMGLLETRIGDGTYVCRRSQFFAKPLLWVIAGGSDPQTRELVEARTLIEVELAGLAAERATPEHIARLEEHVARMAGSLEDPEQFVQADIEFHLALGMAAANSILMNALHLIRNLLQQWVRTAVSSSGTAERANSQHRRILRAVKEHDGPAARKAMHKHLLAMAEFLPSADVKRPGPR